MALQKEIMTAKGVPANYWKIYRINTNEVAENEVNLKVYLQGFYNQESSNAQPLDVKQFNFKGVKDYDGKIYQWIYEKIKETQDFKDAKDVI